MRFVASAALQWLLLVSLNLSLPTHGKWSSTNSLTIRLLANMDIRCTYGNGRLFFRFLLSFLLSLFLWEFMVWMMVRSDKWVTVDVAFDFINHSYLGLALVETDRGQ